MIYRPETLSKSGSREAAMIEMILALTTADHLSFSGCLVPGYLCFFYLASGGINRRQPVLRCVIKCNTSSPHGTGMAVLSTLIFPGKQGLLVVSGLFPKSRLGKLHFLLRFVLVSRSRTLVVPYE
ncbi:hypothetical protein BKA91DRAFT_42049 [Yarrowia lipolytica]|nr:hypothetical protein BKA91DRAFT_42049 [Yarrowia lipolytica]KAE8169308.1 hypothetical protein BKA90DRAFT_49788 [Yarrowia lipolytica]